MIHFKKNLQCETKVMSRQTFAIGRNEVWIQRFFFQFWVYISWFRFKVFFSLLQVYILQFQEQFKRSQIWEINVWIARSQLRIYILKLRIFNLKNLKQKKVIILKEKMSECSEMWGKKYANRQCKYAIMCFIDTFLFLSGM